MDRATRRAAGYPPPPPGCERCAYPGAAATCHCTTECYSPHCALRPKEQT